MSSSKKLQQQITEDYPLWSEQISMVIRTPEREPVEEGFSSGNSVTPLHNGGEAYPAMLKAIRESRRSVWLSTYQFDRDSSGIEFIDALHQATVRGVEIRVLIDSIGAILHWPTVRTPLVKLGINVAMFNPIWKPNAIREWRVRYHRKLLIVDGTTGFTGGMNIQRIHLVNHDVHFIVQGPVVGAMQTAFVEDWYMTTGEKLNPAPPDPVVAGSVAAKAVYNRPSMPSYIRSSLLCLIRSAYASIKIVTPFFLPGSLITSELIAAQKRGVYVQVLVPLRNFRLVERMSSRVLKLLLNAGCEVHSLSPPFDHSKILVIDDELVSIGSTNWDPLSLNNNLEFNIECRCPALISSIQTLISSKLRSRLDKGKTANEAMPQPRD